MLPRALCPAALLMAVAPLASAAPPGIDPGQVFAAMHRAADWQLAHPSPERTDGWVQGAFYAGLSAWDPLSGDPRYHAALLKIGRDNEWKLGRRIYDADDQCVGQMYAEMYLRDRQPIMIAALRARCDYILAHPKDDNLRFVGKDKNDRWAWCDSLFMAPPAWVRLAAATGNRAYRDYAVAQWWATSRYLYDPSEHLYYRDSTYFNQREKNGQKVFWGRGNGWVLAGLARVLDFLPADDPSRPQFEQQFREIAARIRELQQPDGFWRTSLLDPADFPGRETSGTGFFCYGLAWGVNHGLLDRATYEPTVGAAWRALTQCLTPAGELTYVQPIGAAPGGASATSTVAYGAGAFLLSGCEIYRMAGAAP